MHPNGQSAASGDIEIAALLRAVSASKMWIAVLAVTAGVTTFLALSLFTPFYSSEVHILIEREDNAYTRPADERVPTESRKQTDQEAVSSQVQVLQSRDLALGVVNDLKLADNPEFNSDAGTNVWIRRLKRLLSFGSRPTQSALQERVLDAFFERLTVYQVERSHVIAAAFQSHDPETAAKVANRLAELYLTWQQSEKLKQTKEASSWLSAQVKELTKKVEAADLAAERFRSQTGLFEGSNNTTLDAQQLSELNSQLILAKAQRTEAEARAKLIKKMLDQKGDVAGAADVINSRLIQRLLEQRVRVQRQLAELSATLMPSHPRVRESKSELADLMRQIRDEARKVVSSLQNEAQIAGAREASLRESLAEIKQTAARGNENLIKLRALEREATANRELLESYLARYRDASARSDESSVPAHASIISHAHVSNEPSFPKKVPIALLVTAATGLLGFAYTMARELIAPRQVYAGYDPYAATAPSPAPTATDTRPGGAIGARSARDAAAKLSSAMSQRVIVTPISGNVEAAGQAIDTARELAAMGSSAVLVDILAEGDHIAIALDLPEGPGAVQLLRGETNFESAVRRDPDTALQVISGTLTPGQPCELDERKLGSLLEALESTYDKVIFYASTGQARQLAGMASHGAPAIVIVTGQETSRDDAQWVADQIVSDVRVTPNVIVLSQGRGPLGSLPQMPFWRRAAAV